MKRFAATVVILMLGILPATAENVTTEPVRGADLDAMVREVLEWIAQNTEYSVSGSPDVVFVDRATAAIAEYEKRDGDGTAWDKGPDYRFSGLYNPTTKTVYLRDDWGGHTSLDWAFLTHELVHYAQDEANKKFECLEDEELEAYVLSFDFLNDRFGYQWPQAARNLRAKRKEQNTCTPSSIPPTVN